MTGFKSIGKKTLSKYGTFLADFRVRLACKMTAMTRLNRLRRSNAISFASIFKLYKSVVNPHFLFAA